MKTVFQPAPRTRAFGFTLVEMLIVVAIIALLAAMTLGGYSFAMRGSRERTTRGTFESIKTALENYQSEFGEYPEPATTDKVIEIIPGKAYNVGGAACLYQALRGDGFDQIKGVSAPAGADASSASDGKVEGDSEVKNMMMKEMPQTMWTKKGNFFIIIDAFGRPFQYVKAGTATTGTGGAGGASGSGDPTTINSTYDLWSYSYDEMNTTKKSVDTLKDPKLGLKWIKNW